MKTLIEEDLPMQIDCCQWDPNSSHLAIGAYQLDKVNTDLRIGRLYILRLTEEIPGGFQIILEKESPGGLLDLKFSKNSTIALATSTGLHIYTLDLTTPTLTLLVSIATSPTSPSMALYIQWINEQKLIFSDSEGNLNLVESNHGDYFLSKRKKLHDALSWICHYSFDQNMIYCGCDDGKFTAFEEHELVRDEVHFVSKFEVGVTSITSCQNLLAIGGYDDILKIHLLSTKSPKPQLIPKATINLGGAVWRSMFLPSLHGDKDTLTIATACARSGVKFVEYDRIGDVLGVGFEHLKYEGALCYGLDVKVTDEGYLVASGYFDNHVLCVFSI